MKQNLMRYVPYMVLLCVLTVLLCGCTNRTEQEMPFTEISGQPGVTEPGMEILPEKGNQANKDIEREEGVTLTATLPLKPTGTPIPTSTPVPTSTPTPTPVITDPYDGRYWTGKYAEDTDVLMTCGQIQEQNARNFAVATTKLVNLSEVTDYSVAEVASMIESYSLPSRNYYDNHEITASDKEALLRERNLSGLWNTASGRVMPEYGILVVNGDLRSFPADKRLTAEVQGRFDYLQETKLLIGEPVLVLHRSADAKWCFVQAENYYGWIKEDAIAYCSRAELETVTEAMALVDEKRIVVVTKNGNYRIGEQELYLRMGTRLFCADTGDKTSVAQQIAVSLPRRDANGRLVWKTASVCSTDAGGDLCFAEGYLPYTRANVMELAVRILGAPYAWGDAPSFGADVSEVGDNGMDCSSTVSAVFRCFGFVLPRNTGTQRKMDCVKQELSAFGLRQRQSFLDGLQGGELLYTSGHVMLYLGNADGEYYVLHNTSTESRDDGGKDEFYRCVITTTGLGKTGQTILERLIQMNALISID